MVIEAGQVVATGPGVRFMIQCIPAAQPPAAPVMAIAVVRAATIRAGWLTILACMPVVLTVAPVTPIVEVRGVVMTMFDSRTNLSNDVVNEVRKHFPDRVFDAVVPRSIRLAEAPSYGLPISIYDPKSNGALAYQALAEEILSADKAAVLSA